MPRKKAVSKEEAVEVAPDYTNFNAEEAKKVVADGYMDSDLYESLYGKPYIK